MSREQWGHGYYKGVHDERLGLVPIDWDIDELVSFFIRGLRIVGCGGNVEVKSAYIQFSLFGGLSDEIFKDIYDFILAHPGYDGCYISGHNDANWNEDVFILQEVTE